MSSQTLQEIQEQARVQGGGGKKDWVSAEQQEQIKEAFGDLRKVVGKLQEQLADSDDDLGLATETRLSGPAADRTDRRTNMPLAKQAQGALDFDDLLLYARNLLRDHEPVRQRVASGIRLLMVDEFQDTDPVQADVVRSLCGAAA